mgnify:FL=1
MDDEIISSLTFGGHSVKGKIRLEAVCAALREPSDLEVLLNFLSQEQRLSAVTDKVLAFRTSEEEGYDDGSTLAAGEKLLHMLERMNVENIVVMIFFWGHQHLTKPPTELFKVILDEARKLLLDIHAKLISMKVNTEPRTEVTRNQTNFEFSEIPQAKFHNSNTKRLRRPQHFLADRPEPKHLELEELKVTETEVCSAVTQVENSLRTLEQSDVIHLREMINHPLVQKVLQMACILKGYSAATIPNIKQMLDSRTFKVELSMLDIRKLKHSQVKKVREILVKNKILNVDYLTKISIPAATVLSWVEGVVTWFAGRHLVKNNDPFSPKSGLESFQDKRQSEVSSISKMNKEEEEPQIDPELELKLKVARQYRIENEERIDRILQNRLEEIDFEGEKVELTEEDFAKYLKDPEIHEQPTSILIALVDRLKQKRS